jgi:hypothetical protein
LLHNVYLATFRFTDLLSILQTDKWKMKDAARQSFNQTLETVRGQLKELDDDRKQFQEKPENSQLADKTDGSITGLLPNIEAVAAAVTQYDSPAQGAQYREPGDQLRELQKSLRPYVLYLRAKVAAAGAPNPQGPAAPQAPSEPAAQIPPTSAPQPSAQAPQAQAAEPRQTQPPSPADQGVKLEPAQVSDGLRKVYMAAFRFADLLSVLQTDKWKMEDASRQSFNQTLETVHGQLKRLDESRQQFQEKPDNSELADKTDAAITALLPNMDLVAAAVTQFDGPAQGTQYKQPGEQLHELQELLRPYVRYLHAKAEAALALPPGVQGEVIQPSTTAKGIIPADTGGSPAPMQPEQLKELLSRMYVSAFRIQDLLNQEHPEKWKAPDAEHTGFNQAREALRARLTEFEKVRYQFAATPASADLAFRTYRAVGSLQEPLEQVGQSVSAHEDAKLADEYQRRGRELTAGQEQLVPYISYFLNRWDRAAQMFQNNLAACENQLSGVMRNRVPVPTPLPNVNPEFQGHRRKTASSKPRDGQATTTAATKKESRSAKPSKQ